MTNTNQSATSVASRLHNQLKQTRRKFEIEKNCKNQAYYFIIGSGLLDSFSVFCRNYSSDDWHKECIKLLFVKSSGKEAAHE